MHKTQVPDGAPTAQRLRFATRQEFWAFLAQVTFARKQEYIRRFAEMDTEQGPRVDELAPSGPVSA